MAIFNTIRSFCQWLNHGRLRPFKLGISLFLSFLVFSIVSLYVLNAFFHVTTSNAVLFFVISDTGTIEVKNDLIFEESERLLFTVDARWIFNTFLETSATARGNAVQELTWDRQVGRGIIKEFRSDGTRMAVILSRFMDLEGTPHGLFVGGDLPFLDASGQHTEDANGISYFDGTRWYHIWCAINEGLSIAGIDKVYYPEHWNYVDSKIVKSTMDEIIIESTHEIDENGVRIRMIRSLSKTTAEDYILLKITFVNLADSRLIMNYSIGDEPWIGDYSNSLGDVGWIHNKLIKYETLISPTRNRYAGFIDRGNDVIGETTNYTGIASFIEWLGTPPSIAYFSNDFSFETLDESRPLDSYDNRVLNLSWIQQSISPGKSKTYSFAIGMAPVNKETGMPEKPVIYNN